MSDRVELRHDGIVEAPTWFGPKDRPLFGWFVYPESEKVRGAVVLCQPLAEEGNMAYRTFRRLSQWLAREGFLAFRFDYDGTGDSAGSFEDPDRGAAWVASVEHAVSAVRATGVDRVSMVGMRMGATLAYAAAARGALDLDQLVFWDPASAGRAFLRELQMVHALWLENVERAPEGWVETPSYRFTPEAVADVRALGIDGRTDAETLARRLIVLEREDRPLAAKARSALESPQTDWLPAHRQDALLNVPTILAAVPMESLADVVDVLGAHAPHDTTAIRLETMPTATWAEGGLEITESAVFLGPDRGLFGINTSGTHTSRQLDVLLLPSISSERHLGEGRSWVRLARTLAGRGYEAVRFDHSGVGDSVTRPGHTDDTIYDLDWLDDVPYVARQVSDGRGVTGIGLCSSATSLLEAALTGTVSTVIAINAGFLVEADNTLPRAWATYVHRAPWNTSLAIAHRRTADLLWRSWASIDPTAAPLWIARKIVRSGARVILLVGSADIPGITQNRLWASTWGRALRQSGRFSVRRLHNADHSLRVSSGQDEAERIVLQLLPGHAAN